MPRTVQPDRWLFLATLALCVLGEVMVFSASAVMAREEYGSAYIFLARQLLWLALGLAGMFGLMKMDYRKLRQPVVIFTSLCVVVLLLVAVFFLDKSHAAHRWIRWGAISLQPSEPAKLVVICYLAWFLELRRPAWAGRPAQPGKPLHDWPDAGAAGENLRTGRVVRPGSSRTDELVRTLGPSLGPVVVIVALVVLQPDLGTALEIFLVSLAMLFVAGLSAQYVLYAGAAALPAIYLLIVRVPYRYERVLAFLNPEADPQGRGFQLLQSLIAVGSGGLTGLGLMESRQKLFYLPEAHTDFIYAVLCEELGLVGGVAVIGLFALYGWRGFRAAVKAPDDFARFTAVGITAMVVGQALINFSVVLGMMPTKGIPLPFISYGGSNLLVMLLGTGVLLNISQQAQQHGPSFVGRSGTLRFRMGSRPGV